MVKKKKRGAVSTYSSELGSRSSNNHGRCLKVSSHAWLPGMSPDLVCSRQRRRLIDRWTSESVTVMLPVGYAGNPSQQKE